ncbi:ATP-binding protein [Adlercreutzia muris]|uniref:ATP-binding protein n=1 Tax=Adlercreutzia muris TaxID=1796610 RepID=UPI00351829FD
MPSTTDNAHVCEFCGRPLEFKELPKPFVAKGRDDGRKGKPFGFYLDCQCADSVRHRQEIERAEEASRREEEREDFYRRLERAGVKKRYEKAAHELEPENTQKVLEGKSLYICGEFGTGKTHLASAIARKLIWRRKRVRMLTGIDITMMLQATYGSSESEADVLARLANVPILIIDDMGKEPPSDWVLSRLFAVINARYDKMLPTIITTNYEKSALVERMGKHGDHDTAEAMVSRICEMCELIKLTGEDRRLS